ncbi:hypothetical protein GRI40_06825 [Altererythrobacter aerius]|uniref:Uncharacterized protein n=1 Tax=Tsuneonella aeria TaxID=1837929 RepID=A0A6I4TCZ8_9SPHN|nr:hypothetical protein [Tsuneonella aeria]MXO74933.1 hypothetical protein [Tsuneonella aeria]
MKMPETVLFASDAHVAVAAGLAVLLLATLARYAESRRVRRARIDRVGWMPWTGLFLVLMVIGLTLVGLGAVGLVRG